MKNNYNSIAEIYSKWAFNLKNIDIPEEVQNKLQIIVMDSIGLMASAKKEPYVVSLINALKENGNCILVGHEYKTSPFNASIINGTSVHGEDFDDTFEGTPVHVGAVMVPAMLSAVQANNLSGPEFLRGLAIGSELICRLALVAPTAVHRQGFHPTAIFGAFGSSIGISSVIGSNIKQMSSALGVVGSMASGIIEYLAEGTSTKRLHPGWAAGCGYQSANIAKSGFIGPRTVFEGMHGVFNSFAKNNIIPDFSHITDQLGSRWECTNLAIKPYACGTMAQPFIDCAIKIRDKISNIEEIDKIIAQVGEGTVHRLWEPLKEKQNPSSPYGAKFSVPYCIAIGLLDGEAGLMQFTDSRLKDTELMKLTSKISYEINPKDEYPKNYSGNIKVFKKNGEILSANQPSLRGGKKDPLSIKEVYKKFEANLNFAGIKKNEIKKLSKFVENIFKTKDFKNLSEIDFN
ncbi:MAG: MmgE/PrpD family protein [Alphaproteobacteria bacterium]|jgi:2-methylcitrate dehydratase PrpD|nr:MmgE/PrpD family protein [Alphaproteobacteria bacterium]